MTRSSDVLQWEERINDALGDPDLLARLAVEADAAEEFPAQLCARLDALELARYYVPTAWGGALDDHERLLRTWRVVARADLTAAVAHAKTFLGTATIWLCGTAEQAAAAADAVLTGAPVAWALSEPDHGADLRNGSVTATAVGDGYLLDGVKSPINNATRADYVTVLARTGAVGSTRGYSLFFVDKSALPPDTWHTLPKVRTHGVRGIDLSGIVFTGAPVPASARLGPEGTGLESVLRALQLTRIMCTALSLGAGEHALRLVARFVAERETHGHPMSDRAHFRSTLARCTALLAAVEAATLVGSRSVHALTRELSVTSPVVKALAPTLVDTLIGESAELLGLRSYLRDVHEHGAFQKVWRDHQVVAIFDGSTPVNRAALIQQFPRLVRGFQTGVHDVAGLTAAVAIGESPQTLDPEALTLISQYGCSIVQSLPALTESLAMDAPADIAEQSAVLCRLTGELIGRMKVIRPAARPPMAAYELAAAYELCYAGAACLRVWAANADQHSGEHFWKDGLWVRVALRHLLARLAEVLRLPLRQSTVGTDELDGLLSNAVLSAVSDGGAITPFGAPVPLSALQPEDGR